MIFLIFFFSWPSRFCIFKSRSRKNTIEEISLRKKKKKTLFVFNPSHLHSTPSQTEFMFFFSRGTRALFEVFHITNAVRLQRFIAVSFFLQATALANVFYRRKLSYKAVFHVRTRKKVLIIQVIRVHLSGKNFSSTSPSSVSQQNKVWKLNQR